MTSYSGNIGTGADVGAVAGTGILTLAAGDHIAFAVRCTSDTTDMTITEMSFNLHKI